MMVSEEDVKAEAFSSVEKAQSEIMLENCMALDLIKIIVALILKKWMI
jgi:hypothetical protein